MLSCKDVAERASTLIDGDLGLLEWLQMRFHLMMCKGCGAFIRQMRVTRDLTDAATGPDPATATGDDPAVTSILARLRDARQAGD
ncbi:hypothetical protein PSAL_037310 (plasmid) [Pseudooceanicola algae]|uniref:Putative zinc-finger domain-containing protein n=2 Tax=Pseudooceanicola algae TaxID=1537215 RepID=A0A418SBM3_9RHOB|nr:hypothetical protein PSAL_037310 [Pseudooceanicola algae]